MILTKRQEEGLQTAVARHRAGYKFTTIAGYISLDKASLVEFV